MRRAIVLFLLGMFLLAGGCYDKTTCCLVDGGCDAGGDTSADADAASDADASPDASRQ